MINNVVLMGRLVQEPELKKTQTNKSVLSFALACDDYVNREKRVEFVDCVVWGQGADYLSMYAKKGNVIGVVGKIQNRAYTSQDGRKIKVTEVLASKVQIVSYTAKEKIAQEETVSQDEPVSEAEYNFSEDDLPFY